MMIRTSHPASSNVRSKLLMSSASVAIAAVALAPQPARAQSLPPSGAFQGTTGGVTGNLATIGAATRSTGTGTDTITVSTQNTQIDWTPFDQATGTTAPIEFLPSANTASGPFQK